MRFVSPMLRHVVYPVLSNLGYFRHVFPKGNLCVATYHGVLPEGYEVKDPFLDGTMLSFASFRRQLRLLRSRYNVISPAQFLAWLENGEALPHRALLLTCDDGLLNNVTDMVPLLQDEHLTCLFFITGASATEAPGMLWYLELYLILMRSPKISVDFSFQGIRVQKTESDAQSRRSLWLRLVRSLSRLGREKRRAFLDDVAVQFGLQDRWQSSYTEDLRLGRRFALMDGSALSQLCGAGMSIGAHSLSHPALSEQTLEEAEAEIVESRRLLVATSGRPVWAFAYPFGDPASAGDREFGLAQKAGFKCAFMNSGGILSAVSPRFALPRVHIGLGMSVGEFDAHISGFHHDLQNRFQRTSNEPGVGLVNT